MAKQSTQAQRTERVVRADQAEPYYSMSARFHDSRAGSCTRITRLAQRAWSRGCRHVVSARPFAILFPLIEGGASDYCRLALLVAT